jgi:hypothetical protein
MGNTVLFVITFIGISVLLLIIFSIVNQKIQSRFLEIIINILGFLLILIIGLLILYIFIVVLFTSLYMVYIILYFILTHFFEKDVTTFLSLFGVLSFGVYFPDKAGYLFIKLLDFVTVRNIHKLYPSFIRLLRLKLWVYLFAFLITIISSIETIGCNNIINIKLWLNIKPFIIQAVVAFIAFDRFINLIKAQFTDIQKDINTIMKNLNNLLRKQVK